MFRSLDSVQLNISYRASLLRHILVNMFVVSIKTPSYRRPLGDSCIYVGTVIYSSRSFYSGDTLVHGRRIISTTQGTSVGREWELLS